MELAAAPPAPLPLLKVRLSFLMFLMYGMLGAWYPVFTSLLHDLRFTPRETAWAYASYAFCALISPLIWGQIADRFLAAQHCISLCAMFSAACLFAMIPVQSPITMFWLCIFYFFFHIPVVSVSTSLILRKLSHPEVDFGPIRMWGTIGWVVANWFLSFWLKYFPTDFFLSQYSQSLIIGGVLGVVLAFYACSLPALPPTRAEAKFSHPLHRFVDAPMQAFQLFRQRSFAIYAVCVFGLCGSMPFASQMMPLLLRKLDISEEMVPTVLTMGQSTEVLLLLFLPALLPRLGLKPTLLIGVFAWATGHTLWAWGHPAWLVILSLGLHGVFICCFFVSGQLFVNRAAAPNIRISAQAMLQWVNGGGLLVGNLSVGWLRDWSGDEFFWCFLPAAIVAWGLWVLLALQFRTPAEAQKVGTESTQASLRSTHENDPKEPGKRSQDLPTLDSQLHS